MGAGRLMPSAQDYATVGHLYRGVRNAISALCDAKGEAAMFVGDPALQVGPELASLPGLLKITDKASALQALDVIVEQGEGSPADTEHSHYRRFIAIRDSYERSLAQNPGFDPSRPVAPNPVMRKPPAPEGKTFIDEPAAALALDFANALYGAMLRALVQGFAEHEPTRKRAFLDTAIDGMFAIGPVAQYLTRLPASPRAPGLNAGMTFAMLRDVAPMPEGPPQRQCCASGCASWPMERRTRWLARRSPRTRRPTWQACGPAWRTCRRGGESRQQGGDDRCERRRLASPRPKSGDRGRRGARRDDRV